MKFRKKHGSGGFSLVEACVAVAIMAILLCIGFVEIIKHQRELKVQEMDNLARAAYMAAENQALDLSRAGMLVDAVSVAGGTFLHDVSFTDKDGVTHTYASGTPVSAMASGGFGSGALEKTALAYVPAGALKAAGSILMDEKSVDPKISAGYVYLIYDLFSGTVVDAYYAAEGAEDAAHPDPDNSWSKLAGIMNDPAPASASIYGILSAGWDIVTTPTNPTPKNVKSVADRATERAFVGRYDSGVSAVRNVAPETAGNVEVNIYNNDNLYVEIIYPKDSSLEIKASYATASKTGEMNLTEGSLVNTLPFAGVKKGVFYLDGDPSRTDNIGKTRFGRGKDPSGSDWWKNASGGIVTFNDISGMFTIEVTAVRDGYRDGDTIVKQGQPLFADGSTPDTAVVTALRHLQNLDTAFSGTIGIKSVVQRADINAKGSSYEFKPIVNDSIRSYLSAEKGSGEYYKIANLNVTQASIGSKPGAGLFARVMGESANPFRFINVGIVNATVDTENLIVPAGALLGTLLDDANFAVFTGCTIDGGTITGKKNIGGLAGYVKKAKFYSCVIGQGVLVTVNVQGVAGSTDAFCAGGMVGRGDGTAIGDFTADGCRIVNATVTGNSYRSCVGGLTGLAQGATFKNCTIGDYTRDDGVTVPGKITIDGNSTFPSAEYVVGKMGSHVGSGGMIGQAINKIKLEKCTVAGTATDDVSIIGRNIADHVGGIIGYARNLNPEGAPMLKECSVKGITVESIAGGAAMKDSGHVGGMVGFAQPNLTMTDCIADSVIVTKEKASDYRGIGGLVGFVGKVEKKHKDEPEGKKSVETINVAGKATLTGCKLIGNSKITGKGYRNYVGGMVGYAVIADMNGNEVDGGEVFVEYLKYVGDLDTPTNVTGRTNTVFSGGMVGITGLDHSGESVFNNCNVKNIKVSGNGKPRICAGGFVGVADRTKFNYCTADRVYVTGASLSAVGDKYNNTGGLGGFVGYSNLYVIMNNCHVINSTIDDEETLVAGKKESRLDAGGMLGSMHEYVTLTSCTVTGTIVEGSRYAGGMVAFVEKGGNIFTWSNISGTSVISDSPLTSVAGGILGSTYAKDTTVFATFNNCSASGVTVTATKSVLPTPSEGAVEAADLMLGAYAGGIVGRADHLLTVINCTVTDVTALSVDKNAGVPGNISSAGGIAGRSVDEIRILNCEAVNVAATSPWDDNGGAGGIAGYLKKVREFSGCGVYWEKNKLPFGQQADGSWSVTPQITGRYAGGLIGRMDLDGTIDSSFAATFLSGYYSGGMLGASYGSGVKIRKVYADSVLGGHIKGGLVGGNLNGSKITMEAVYAVAAKTDWDYPDKEHSGAALSFAGLCGKGKLDVKNSYANLYKFNTTDALTPALSGASTGNSFTNCFWISGSEARSVDTNGSIGASVAGGTPAAKSTLNSATSNAFTGPTATNAYLMLSNYPYPGLKNMPHYGDWNEGIIGNIEIKGKTALELFGVDVRALKKDDENLADSALKAVNKKLGVTDGTTVGRQFTYDGKTYKFSRAMELSFITKDGKTDYSRASLLFAAELYEGGTSKGFAIMKLTCDDAGNGGLRTEASMAMTKAMLEKAAFTEVQRPTEGGDNAFKKALADEVVKKLAEKNLNADKAPTEASGWSDYNCAENMFAGIDSDNAVLETKKDDMWKLSFAFTLKKAEASMEPDASEKITATFPKHVLEAVKGMSEKTDWLAIANVTVIGLDKGGDAYGNTPVALAAEASKLLETQGYGDCMAFCDDTAQFSTSDDGKYAIAEFTLQRKAADGTWADYKNNDGSTVKFTLKTRRDAEPSVVTAYLQQLDNLREWQLSDGGDVYAYAIRNADNTLSLKAELAALDKKDFEDAVRAVLKDLEDNRGLGGYTLIPGNLAIKIIEAAGGTKEEHAFMTFGLQKGAKAAPVDLEAKIFVCEGFAADAVKLLHDKAYNKTLLLTDRNLLLDIEGWARGKLERMGYSGAIAETAGIALVKEPGAAIATAKTTMKLQLPPTTGAAAEMANVTVKLYAYDFVAELVVNTLPKINLPAAFDENAIRNEIIKVLPVNVAVKQVSELADKSGYKVVFGAKPMRFGAIPGFDVQGLEVLDYTVVKKY